MLYTIDIVVTLFFLRRFHSIFFSYSLHFIFFFFASLFSVVSFNSTHATRLTNVCWSERACTLFSIGFLFIIISFHFSIFEHMQVAWELIFKHDNDIFLPQFTCTLICSFSFLKSVTSYCVVISTLRYIETKKKKRNEIVKCSKKKNNMNNCIYLWTLLASNSEMNGKKNKAQKKWIFSCDAIWNFELHHHYYYYY